MSRVTLVTGNAGKLKEVQSILGTSAAVDNQAIDLPEVQGESGADIAKAKALEAYKRLKQPVLVEDTSLCFGALKDLPGPYIKWFHGKLGNVGLNKMLVGFEDKSAAAVCIFAYADGANRVRVFEGRIPGRIVEPRGDKGFGWDPIFLPDGHHKTFAEMTADEKNALSHRRLALDLFKVFLDEEAPKGPAANTRKRSRSNAGIE